MLILQKFMSDAIRVWLVILLLSVGGTLAFLHIPRLEDPAFTIKTALVVTAYPGASATQVEENVTRPLEDAIQRLPSVDKIRSVSDAGLSQITVTLRPEYHSSQLPQIWDELRNRVQDTARRLPAEASAPVVRDDFGDVYGYYFSLSGEHYTLRELGDYAEYLRRELMRIPGVSNVVMAGDVTEVVNIDIASAALSAYGLTPARLANLFSDRNALTNTDSVRTGGERLPVRPTGALQTLDDLNHLLLTSHGSSHSLYLGDIARLTRAETSEPENRYFSNGHPAIALGVAFAPDVNVVKVGEAINDEMHRLSAHAPAGMTLTPFYDQSAAVKHAVKGFIINFLMAVVIVVATLMMIMGLRNGIVIALSLTLNVLGTLLIMNLAGLELQRVSLGAMIIVLSVLADNAIEMVVGIRTGRSLNKTVMQATLWNVRRSALPLLGATIIAILAFAPVGLSQNSTGEYCRSLFFVLLISLLLSWLTSLTLTPVFIKWLTSEKESLETLALSKPAEGSILRYYRRMLEWMLDHKTLTLGVATVLLLTSAVGFSWVRQSFFPPSTTPVFLVDLWLPNDSDPEKTVRIAKHIEEQIRQQTGVNNTLITTGQGGLRFILTYNPQRRSPNYAQIMVSTFSVEQANILSRHLRETLSHSHPGVNVNVRRIMFGPSSDSAVEIRFQGPSPSVLRQLAQQAEHILRTSAVASGIRNSWQEPGKVIRPHIDLQRARALGVNKQDLDNALRMNFSGIPIGIWREGTQALPVVLRTPENERLDIEHLNNMLVWSQARQQYIPLSNLIDKTMLEWDDAVITRSDRIRTLSVMADPDLASGKTAAEVVRQIRPQIEAIPLPQGYRLSWGADDESASQAKAQLYKALPLGFLAMFIITVLMFNSVRNALAIWLTIPLALIGVTLGFLLTGIPFGFMALIGLLSLSGMMIRNGIVLVEEINRQRETKNKRTAIIDSAVARFPVVMTAFTTVFGLAPLLRDRFFQSMAVVIMFGLGCAIFLILLMLPVLYDALHTGSNKRATGGQHCD
ncbi:efflux RND transporter permease subunit [Pantoea sp. RRHST58]|uniref:efflux RND transporter permease subunit n=1 Tax=Pantoea sp. RRHST58 TaxID=3425183 RepID=UPI003DA1ADB9